MSNREQYFDDLEALTELEQDVKTDEDRETLQGMREEVAAERAGALAVDLADIVALPDGTVVHHSEALAAQKQNGHSHTYGNGRRA